MHPRLTEEADGVGNDHTVAAQLHATLQDEANEDALNCGRHVEQLLDADLLLHVQEAVLQILKLGVDDRLVDVWPSVPHESGSGGLAVLLLEQIGGGFGQCHEADDVYHDYPGAEVVERTKLGDAADDIRVQNPRVREEDRETA